MRFWLFLPFVLPFQCVEESTFSCFKTSCSVLLSNLPEQASQSPQKERAFSDYAETMRFLRQRLEEPFVTVNSVTGDIGMKQAQDEYDKLIRNKTPKSRR